MSKSYMNCEMARRADGMVNVWAYLPWPDDDPPPQGGLLGWQVVHVATTMRDAHNWVHNNAGKVS